MAKATIRVTNPKKAEAKKPTAKKPTPAKRDPAPAPGPADRTRDAKFVTVLGDGLLLVHPPETEPAPRASEPPTHTLVVHRKTKVALKWVPGRTEYDVKKAANVYREARLELHAGKAPKVLSSGGRLSYALLNKHKKAIDAAFGRELTVIDVSKTLVIQK